MKKNYTAQLAEASIFRQIEKLIDLLNKGKTRNGLLGTCKFKLKTLDEANPDYRDMLEDRRENMKVSVNMIIFILSMFFDFLLLYNALTIICHQLGWQDYLRYAMPVGFILVEIGISYFTVQRHRNGLNNFWLTRILPYLILFILLGASILALQYLIEGYNSDTNPINFWGYFTSTVISQLAFLISSIMLHIWLIRNAEQIVEAIAYLQYKAARSTLTNRIESIENSNITRLQPRFSKLTYYFIRDMDDFRRTFPEIPVDFISLLSEDLKNAINIVMGRNIFPNSSDEPVV